ncbi:Na+/H+ antiporter subunit E [Thiobacillus sp. 65-1402]|uniref:Na+/H+ antiporter subunit E n=1 Tax=Thiobacillus sp. 65-1402 TaxID=1895861 RepID=UPI000B1B367B|nr:Na+/H+ antiporter subunit E [Thiobacillus sp. 65-1402]
MKRKPLLPLLPIVLVAMWLLLNDSLSAGQIVLGILLALLVAFAIAPLRPLPAWPHRLHLAIGLIFHVLHDIIRSNLAVGSIILGASRRQPRVGFMKIPLDMRDPHGLAMLTIIVTATPGTVWAGHDADSNVLTLHVLDLQDEAAWVRTIKQRYERPLMEIFE